VISLAAAPSPQMGAAVGVGPARAAKLLASDLLHLHLPILVPGCIPWLFNTAARSGVTGEVAAVPASAPSLAVPAVPAGSVFLAVMH